MFASLRGKILNINQDKVILEVNSVGYLLNASHRTITQLEIGKEFFLLIETIVREDQILLIAFFDSLEQDWFKLLTTVKGIGSKLALQILSQANLGELAIGIARENKSIFKNISGVGSKVADRIIVELKDKVLPLSSGDFIEEAGSNQEIDDAVLALTALGYNKFDAAKVATKIIKDLPELKTREIIKLALKELSK
ncbi:Holliday junction branch migration protein RuvA [Rickettsiales endosymbiont of Stachyamoeba lipophora]|uniref:Holliday junction branch migration protein RuvA n=1 Tax=Rickettsiales endosymbiont of Stachyamoeba lipophora TaxID=2486578 RepID=UPI000F645842|nr:Holliday junction branch migration protein RuvA [Rickettsiales endosymbiont of Stachyamoeba lipophora]AZL15834.1 Holliday junction branch migration protein RuvA [Rickettsiales endosymbiont of Stachyamoeba lipophora]